MLVTDEIRITITDVFTHLGVFLINLSTLYYIVAISATIAPFNELELQFQSHLPIQCTFAFGGFSDSLRGRRLERTAGRKHL